LAGKVADAAPDEGRADYRSLLRGVARFEQANALRQLGQYDAALPLLREAEGRFAGVPICTHDLGRVWFVRGSVLFKMNGLEEALFWLRLSINIFAALDDMRRIARARVVEGNIFFERADWDGARARWIEVLPVFEASRDWHSLASTWLNLGWCELERGQASTAREWLTRALDRFTRLKSTTDMARTRWPIALAEARFGQRAEGLAALRRELDEFERLRLLTEAGMVELDMVEMLLLERGRWADAAATARRLVPLFERAGAKKEALKALGYLWEAANARMATPELVRHIRSEVKRSEREPGYRFSAENVQ
jgi:tetratricopeptide (TPR) repeat protein